MSSVRDRNYLDWLRSQECPVSGDTPCEPAHTFKSTGGGGMARKSSDKYALPLSNAEHRKQSGMSELKYWRDVLSRKAVLRRQMQVCYTIVYSDRQIDDSNWLPDLMAHDWLVKRMVQAYAEVFYYNRWEKENDT